MIAGAQQQIIISKTVQDAHTSRSVQDMVTTSQTKNASSSAAGKLNLLRTVPYEKGFHFYVELGKYTGITATSLDEFARKLQVVSVESVSFHFQRDDFQNWFRNLIGDGELAARINRFKQRSKFSGEILRRELLAIIQRRLTELR